MPAFFMPARLRPVQIWRLCLGHVSGIIRQQGIAPGGLCPFLHQHGLRNDFIMHGKLLRLQM